MTIAKLPLGAKFSVAGSVYKLLRHGWGSAYVQVISTSNEDGDKPGTKVNIAMSSEVEEVKHDSD